MEELDLKELFNIFWNKKSQIILIVFIFILIGVIYTLAFVTPVYTSSTSLALVGRGANDKTATTEENTEAITATDLTLNSKLVSTYRELIRSKKVIRAVKSNLNINLDEEEIKKNVNVSSIKDTEFIEIAVTNVNPEYATKIANEIANVFTDEVKKMYKINNVYIVDEAEVESVPSNINHTKDIIIFAFIGAVISIIYVLMANMLDTTIKSTEDIEKEFGLPALAAIPRYGFVQKKSSRKGSRNK